MIRSAHTSAGVAGPRLLRSTLESLGPVYAAFGRHLALRRDVLPAAVCSAMSGIADAAPASAESAVRELFARELGYAPEMAFARFDPRPFESRLLWQAHDAWLAGEYVAVRAIHPELLSRVAEFEPAEPLREAFLYCGVTEAALAQVVSGFRELLPGMLSFNRETAAHIAVTHPVGSRASLRAAGESPELARRLVDAWLRQALQGAAFPVDASLENVDVSDDGRIAFPFGPYHTLAEATKVHMRDYLLALTAQDADEACSCLCLELMPDRNDPDNEHLRRRFRQSASFRDGAFDIAAAGSDGKAVWPLQEEIAIHWRIAAESGRMDQAKLLPFYLGLTTVAQAAARLAPGRDWLEEGLRDLTIGGVFDRFKDLLQPSGMQGMLENYATAMFTLPQQMDKVLSRGLPGGSSPAPGREANADPPRSGQPFVLAASLLLALGGILLLAQRFERMGFYVVVVGGFGLLWAGMKCLR